MKRSDVKKQFFLAIYFYCFGNAGSKRNEVNWCLFTCVNKLVHFIAFFSESEPYLRLFTPIYAVIIEPKYRLSLVSSSGEKLNWTISDIYIRCNRKFNFSPRLESKEMHIFDQQTAQITFSISFSLTSTLYDLHIL